MDNLEGGYLIHKVRPVLHGLNRHTMALPGRPISDADLTATNRLQNTQWVNDSLVHGVARELLAAPDPCLLVPADELVLVPDRWADDAWLQATDAEKKKHRAALAYAHTENASRLGKRQGLLDTLDTADRMAPYSGYYFCWNHDFRYRRYVVPTGGLNPQGSKLQKSIIKFARGKALGPMGLYWLCVRAANAYGHDKLPLDERYLWALDNVALFERIAAQPTDWRLWFFQENGEKTDDPWALLATAHELAMAMRMDHPEDFESHLPVALDGTCNGLQHLSALGLDPKGALETNLTASPDRRDIYLAVAAEAQKLVESDAAKGKVEALVWLGHVDRAAVKRAVLATPYGVTDEGIRRQLVEDGKVPSNDLVSPKDSSAYFRDVLVDSLGGTVVAAKSIMAWFQACALKLGEAGLPMDWTTPMGSTCRQAYIHRTASRVDTLVGTLRLQEETPGGALDARKQALGSSPQIVHSLDAAHLARTVNVCGEVFGITDFAMIHDSYGTHAGSTSVLSNVLRETFVEQYRENYLEKLAEGWRSQAPHVDIAPPPPRGSFDLEEVLRAPFFFS
jgi:DNA-directed RNA polymerase